MGKANIDNIIKEAVVQNVGEEEKIIEEHISQMKRYEYKKDVEERLGNLTKTCFAGFGITYNKYI